MFGQDGGEDGGGVGEPGRNVPLWDHQVFQMLQKVGHVVHRRRHRNLRSLRRSMVHLRSTQTGHTDTSVDRVGGLVWLEVAADRVSVEDEARVEGAGVINVEVDVVDARNGDDEAQVAAVEVVVERVAVEAVDVVDASVGDVVDASVGDVVDASVGDVEEVEVEAGDVDVVIEAKVGDVEDDVVELEGEGVEVEVEEVEIEIEEVEIEVEGVEVEEEI